MLQINITLNLLRTSRTNPKISAFSQIHGTFDFNKTPVALLGCKIIIHNRANECRTWAPHGTPGFYIGPALQHYSNYRCHIPTTKHTRVSNTVMDPFYLIPCMDLQLAFIRGMKSVFQPTSRFTYKSILETNQYISKLSSNYLIAPD